MSCARRQGCPEETRNEKRSPSQHEVSVQRKDQEFESPAHLMVDSHSSDGECHRPHLSFHPSQIAMMPRWWRCLCEILGVPVDHDEAQVIAILSFSAAGLSLSSGFRSRSAAGKLGGLLEDGEVSCQSEGVNSRSLRLGWRWMRPLS